LGVECVVVPDLDTDTLGIFSGDVEPTDNAITTAGKKCLMAMDVAGADLAIANEGSFGLHPSIIFAHADVEMLLYH
jgi:hypothetical protein